MLSEALHIPGLPSAALSVVCLLTDVQGKSTAVTAHRQLEDVVRREPCGNRTASLWPELPSSERTQRLSDNVGVTADVRTLQA